jgi:hypothetical protein
VCLFKVLQNSVLFFIPDFFCGTIFVDLLDADVDNTATRKNCSFTVLSLFEAELGMSNPLRGKPSLTTTKYKKQNNKQQTKRYKKEKKLVSKIKKKYFRPRTSKCFFKGHH